MAIICGLAHLLLGIKRDSVIQTKPKTKYQAAGYEIQYGKNLRAKTRILW